jgi:regulator of sigma E protease
VVNVLKVVVGLGMVIFVHELGHFLVAKLCGVKCEKFYLGFDFGGLRLWRRTWGETEYGIGIFPLGGYVKMLGQEDNPARIREEMERARLAGAQAAAPAREAPAARADSPAAGPGPAAKPAPLDPRSYLAKSVGQRMAIISAGVVMNVFFAFLMGTLAYRLGVFHVACGIGAITPGAGAWQANFKVGDRIVAINGKPVQRFVDLKAEMTVGDVEQGVPITILRPGQPEPLTVQVQPRNIKPAPIIGVDVPLSTSLAPKYPALPGSAASRAVPALRGGDKIVEIEGQPIAHYGDVHRQLALHPDKTLRLSVERVVPPPKGSPEAQASPVPQRVAIEVPPMPMKVLGLVMPMGPVTAVQADSPAAQKGIQPGDVIERVDGQPVGPAWDAMSLPERLRQRALGSGKVALTIRREGHDRPIEIDVLLRQADWSESPLRKGDFASAPALGIAYRVPARIEQVLPGSPAALAGIQGGRTIVEAELVPPPPESVEDKQVRKALKSLGPEDLRFELSEAESGWPFFFSFALQQMLPGTTVKLQLDNGEEHTLEPADAADWFNPDRGFRCDLEGEIVRGDSLLAAARLGWRETADSMTLVFRFLRRIKDRARAIVGPWKIAQIAYGSAAEGTAELSLFLMLISANLAVLNFLPIPVLDGGHIVFLAYEGITGRPPNERVQVGLSYVGLLLILALMVWACGLDFGLISRK